MRVGIFISMFSVNYFYISKSDNKRKHLHHKQDSNSYLRLNNSIAFLKRRTLFIPMQVKQDIKQKKYNAA